MQSLLPWCIQQLPLIVGVLVLVATFVTLRPAWLKGRREWQFPQLPGPPPNDKRLPFHQAEFSALKAEVAELIKSVATNFQYATLGSIGVIAWMITETPKSRLDTASLHIGLWLPFVLASFLASLSAAQYIRLGEMAIYLFRLEGALSASGLGWERFFRSRARTIGIVYFIGWAILIGADLGVGAFGQHVLTLHYSPRT
jgi:hypothetical protein